MIFVFLLSFVIAVHSKVTYTRLSDRYSYEDQLERYIRQAISRRQHFYIGAAGERGNPIQSLCFHQGDRITSPRANECAQRSTYHADATARREFGAELIQVVYSNRLQRKSEVCDTEEDLIDDHRGDPLCLNERGGHDHCIQARNGILFLRIYNK